MSKPPDRGSFPLDHFHQCDQEAKKYSQCVMKHQLMPKRCRDFQIQYLECRMKSGLMEHEEMNKLGFVESNSWESEEAQKNYLFQKIQKMKEEAWKAAVQRQKLRRQMADKKPQNLPQ